MKIYDITPDTPNVGIHAKVHAIKQPTYHGFPLFKPLNPSSSRINPRARGSKKVSGELRLSKVSENSRVHRNTSVEKKRRNKPTHVPRYLDFRRVNTRCICFNGRELLCARIGMKSRDDGPRIVSKEMERLRGTTYYLRATGSKATGEIT